MTTDPGDPLSDADTMTTQITVHDDVTVLAVTGSVDLATAPALQDAVDTAASKGSSGMIIDLTRVDFLASAGMTILVEARQRFDKSELFGVVADSPATSPKLRLG